MTITVIVKEKNYSKLLKPVSDPFEQSIKRVKKHIKVNIEID